MRLLRLSGRLAAIIFIVAGFGRADAAVPADQAQCTPARVVGPDGVPGTADDGWIVEDFDTERDGTPGISLDRLPRGTPGVLNDTIGVWVGTAPGGAATLAGIGCGGFLVPPVDPECRIDPDDDMDWHIHCPAGTCANAPGSITPEGGELAASGRNSLHWGHHFDPRSRDGDSTRFRQLAAFMTDPVHLTPMPGAGDLELSFLHVADMMDNNSITLLQGHAVDFGDVQIQAFDAGAAGEGAWGFWDKLAPFANVTDHIPYLWSTYGTNPTYCILTPTDTGSGGHAPRGIRETLCYPEGIWSHCGNSRAAGTLSQCDGPGVAGSTGDGLWVRSRFSLADYAGRTVRIRWIAQSWEFDCCSNSYYELGSGWAPQTGDEGWWIDDIRITGALQSPAPQPTLRVVVAPSRLWPPNHRMVEVHASVTLEGGCSAACESSPEIVLDSVSSDEPDDAAGPGDGRTVADIQDAAAGSADFDLKLRAERDDSGAGRSYRISYTATDCTGVSVSGSALVAVPLSNATPAR